MATLHARLARQAAAQQRVAAALQVISGELDLIFASVNFPREADEPMKRVLLMEQYADWFEKIADELSINEDGATTSYSWNVDGQIATGENIMEMAPKRRGKRGTRKGK